MSNAAHRTTLLGQHAHLADIDEEHATSGGNGQQQGPPTSSPSQQQPRARAARRRRRSWEYEGDETDGDLCCCSGGDWCWYRVQDALGMRCSESCSCRGPTRWVRRLGRKTCRFLENARRFCCGQQPLPPDDEEDDDAGHLEEEEGEDGDGMHYGAFGSPRGLHRLRASEGSYQSLRDTPSANSLRYLHRSNTISVDYLKKRDRRPLQMAWTFFLIYVIAGVWYFIWFKSLSFRDAIFQIINSLSAVGVRIVWVGGWVGG